MNLNIIGNGFDLYHGLPSSYYFFGCYLIKNDPEFYERMTNLYNFIPGINGRTYPDYEYDYAIEDVFWSNFEEHLGDIKEDIFIDTHNYDLGLEINEYDIPMDEDEGAEDIKKAFIRWITDIVDTKENYNIMKKLLHNKIKFTQNDKFLVFNYTHVLQRIYKIDSFDIEYVHGECTGSGDDELIVGHGNDRRIEQLKKIIEGYDSRSLYQSERTEQLEYECLLRFMQRLRKDVNYCMHICDGFYNRFNREPENIKVYGLSMGDVDIPYLQQVRSRWRKAKWHFSYHTEGDLKKVNEVAVYKLNLRSDEYSVFELSNPDSNDILKTIVKLQGIEEYPKV